MREQKNNKARTFAPSYNVEEEAGFNKYDINIDGLDKDGYNINGLDKNGYNINGFEGTRKKYPKRKVNYKELDDDLYDQYGFNSEGFNKDGYSIYGLNRDGFNKDGYNIDGFDIDGLNKDGLDKFGYAKKLGKGLNISALPILLPKIYSSALGRSSKKLIKNIKQLVNNLYKNKQITKQVYNILNINNDS